MPKRHLNKCNNCDYTWHPRGHNVSSKCPRCNSTDVKIVSSDGCAPAIGVLAILLACSCLLSCCFGSLFDTKSPTDELPTSSPSVKIATASEAPTHTPVSSKTITPKEISTTLIPSTTLFVDTSECRLGAAFVTDVTIPDGARIVSGESFTKTWRLRNTGSCAWGSGYALVFTEGDQMKGPLLVSVPEILPGEIADVSVVLVAPLEQARFKSVWRMCVNESECFGTKVFVQITSIAPPTPTLLSTSTPKAIKTSRGEFIVPGVAFLDGRDLEAEPSLTIMSINIWNAVPRERVVCALRHGERVEMLDVKLHREENRYYFEVCSGDCCGWVSELFVGTQYYSPVGDRVP